MDRAALRIVPWPMPPPPPVVASPLWAKVWLQRRPKLSAPVQAMRRLGLVRDIDLALHLPLRYEDETRCSPSARCATARPARSRAW
jgi:hypothetical protein